MTTPAPPAGRTRTAPGSRRHRRFVAGLALVAVVPAACADDSSVDARPDDPSVTASTGAVEPNARVDHVVDGDTIDVIVDGREERVRLTGIDTPEIAHDASGDRPATTGECYGEEASAFVRTLLPVGTPVRLERDVVGRDDYGRLLAYVYRADDGIFVNYEIVRQGYARPLTIPPNVTHAELMVRAARAAETDDVGLWADCD